VRRLPAAVLTMLAAATVGAFFVTQHLKVTTPLIAGFPFPYPGVINPIDGSVCGGVGTRYTSVSFFLLHRTDDVDVSVVDQTGAVVRTLATAVHMDKGLRHTFRWYGHEDNGSFAPDGLYYFRVALIHQGRAFEISNVSGPLPVRVTTSPPHPAVDRVTPRLIPQGAATRVTIDYSGNETRGGTIRIYRTDAPGTARLVKSFATRWGAQRAVWDGTIQGRPAPAGIYLVGLDVTDAACVTGHFPPVVPPFPGSTPNAGVTVRYLAAQPPLAPVPAGSKAIVYVDSRQRLYHWSLWRLGARRPLAAGRSADYALPVPVPRSRGGKLYELALRSGPHATAVPLVATGATRQRVLIVLPALTWQGLNPVDDTGDGLPSTLPAGGPVALQRPLADGLPAGIGDEAALLAYLDRTRRPYDLTTDLALIDGAAPPLAGHAGVILAGTERWVTPSLAAALRAYVQRGGRVLSLGIDSLRRSVRVQGAAALDPGAPAATDVLGARVGALVTRNTDVMTTISDSLGIFQGTSGVYPGFSSYQQLVPPSSASPEVSEAGVSTQSPSIIGWRLGKGEVIEAGLPGFASTLARNVDAQDLLGRWWTVLSQ
jgi:hypothetical protein